MTSGKQTRELDELREEARALLNSIEDYAILLLGADGTVLTWNAGARRYKGYEENEIVGRSFEVFYIEADRKAGLPPRLLAEARDHGRVESEGWRVRKDGSRFWADVVITALRGNDGELRGYLKVTRDLTERRHTEDELRVRARQQAAIAEAGLFALQTRDLQTLFDRTGTIVAQTLEMELVRVLELGSDGKLLVRTAAGWPEIVGRTIERLDDLLTERDMRSGAQVPIESPSDGGVPYGYLGVHSRAPHELSPDDTYFLQAVANVLSSAITRLRMETQLRLAENKAEIERIRARRAREQVRERDDFLSVAAHELRTPLTALQLKLQSIETVWRKKPGEAIAAKFEARIEGALRQVERLTDLVERLLDVSRIAQGRLVLTIESVDLVAIAREVIEGLAPAAEQARCEVRLLSPEAVRGSWDRGRIQQALVNLVANAIKYGGGNPVDIRIEQKDSEVKIAIEDRGIGISEQDYDRIFQRFERAAPLRHYGGLGLGLYITRHIVEAHGGRIWLHSTKGAGSTFTLELPLRSVPLHPTNNRGAPMKDPRRF